MIFDKDVEIRGPEEQRWTDEALYRKQIEYLFARSAFYRRKLATAGFRDAKSVGGLENIHNLPFTVKDELRKSQAEYPPFGDFLAADPGDLMRIYSTSGTTGVPLFIALTPRDMEVWATNTARSYTAGGFRRGQRLVVTFNAGPFVAGAIYFGFDKIGATIAPVGTGNTERLVKGIQVLGGTGVSCTPSYAIYLIDWCRERGIDTRSLGLKNFITAGEPGGGDPGIRERVEKAFGCTLREAMGTGDISTSIWGECEHEGGMHFSARDNTYAELIDPDSGQPVPWENGAQGEIVYTALKREAMPVLRMRSRDHVVVNMERCRCGRSAPRIRCIGRTDDMLIVRGVNFFPSAVRSVLSEFRPMVTENFRIQPKKKGVSQEPPLPVVVELHESVTTALTDLADKIKVAIRQNLLVSTDVRFVRYGTLPREEYKSKLVDYSDAAP